MDLKDRERKVDLKALSPQQLADLELQLGNKIRQICDEACEKANRVLSVYSMKCKMQIVIDNGQLKKEPLQSLAPTKRPRKPKNASQSLA